VDFSTIDPRNTFYKRLMVDQSADVEIITLVYRRLAKRYHPDLNPTPAATRRMIELNEAYTVLRNPELRRRYDAALAARRDRRATDRFRPRASIGTYGEAGVPVGPPWGSMVDFGRYRGWTLGQIYRRDPNFIEWLDKMPIGRAYRTEISTLLRRTA
jgi:curved DNA-binding protein CbpA